MQDNPRHIDDLSRTGFGKGFTDRAWADMHRLLDEEMPVTERRRPLGWWWVFGIVGLAAAAALFYFVKSDAGQASPKQEGPVAEAPLEIEKMAGEIAGASTENEPQPMLKNENSMEATIADAASDKAADFQNSKIKNKSQFTDNQYLKTKESTLPPSILATAKTKNDPPETKLETEPELGRSQLPAAGRAPLVLSEKLAALPLSPLETEPSATPGIEAKCKKPRRIGLAAYAAAYAQPGRSGAGGIGGGVLANMPLGRSRFSVETGLGYAYFQQPLEVVVNSNSEDVFDPGLPVGGGSEVLENLDFGNTPYVSYEYSSESLDKLDLNNGRTSRSPEKLHLHYLNIPLEIHFRHHRWWTFAGANTGILLASGSRLANGGIFDDSAKSDPTFSSANAEQAGSTKIRTFDFAATVGIGFDVSPKIGIDLRYQHGLTDVLKNNGETDLNRFWRAGVRWRF